MTETINSSLQSYFGTPEGIFRFKVPSDEQNGEARFFRFGADTQLYGRVAAETNPSVNGALHDYIEDADKSCDASLPFNPLEVAANLRTERYPLEGEKKGLMQEVVRLAYYTLRPLLPVGVRKYAQRRALRGWERLSFPNWPVERSVDRLFERLLMLRLKEHPDEAIPFIWFWPEGKQGCVLMTHDVETAAGLDACDALMSLNEKYGIRSSFQLIPGGRYHVQPHHIEGMRLRGFEVNIHDWNHDGSLFKERQTFAERATKINATAKKWNTVGFRSAALYRNVDWLRELDFEYDMSIPSCARLDPQRGGCCTLMPWFNGDLLEIPVTTIQDYSLFHILDRLDIEIWETQTKRILGHHGMATFIVHPDYIQTAETEQTYSQLLAYLAEQQSEAGAWIALPQEVNQWWRQRKQMRLELDIDGWHVTGPGSERAVVAFARLVNNDIDYTFGTPQQIEPYSKSAKTASIRSGIHA
ncbi:MAG: hypothetical protein KGN79_16395 [Acidobacteriota bacterium]|nr:hypothetical protein [Acidobacteriota bacterium]